LLDLFSKTFPRDVSAVHIASPSVFEVFERRKKMEGMQGGGEFAGDPGQGPLTVPDLGKDVAPFLITFGNYHAERVFCNLLSNLAYGRGVCNNLPPDGSKRRGQCTEIRRAVDEQSENVQEQITVLQGQVGGYERI
jgi:hypothetical protein